MFATESTYCAFPRQPYCPAELSPAGHLALREALRRAAIWDGLSEDAADEAASAMYLHWLSRDWSKGEVSRGDHARAFYSIRAYARRSFWHGFTGQRRAARGKRVPRDSAGNPVKVSVSIATREEIESQQRRRESMIPGPVDHAMAWEGIENQPWTKKAKRLGDMAFSTGMTPRQVFDAAAGMEPAPRFHPAPVPSATYHATTTARPVGKPEVTADLEAYRAALAEYYGPKAAW